ncbi:EamA family transporter [Paludisphaera rhizosphaerae]|uniref:EamA family transporter n=1 Tax=Paludisphaera rhizosphaerae TaxID=2711216 RepID=UPI0013EA60CF|nr:EamA family transporter [Paludisphaera rhizosphaerae]
MTIQSPEVEVRAPRSLHGVGVTSGLAAGAWLGAAEAPTKLVAAGLTPFIVSLGMVAGVFVARWTVPVMLRGTHSLASDLKARPHLIVWAILAGMLWAVANTLTVFAIRDVGLSIAFPLWNTNSLIGLFWGWLLFNELRGSETKDWAKVLGGAGAIVIGACLLAYATQHSSATIAEGARTRGILAALGAGVLWGTMYIPYRKAYISGMNPLSFVTVFTVGELGTTLPLALIYQGGVGGLQTELSRAMPSLFWLFLGGFCWVLGDLFQQYAAKYIGIGRGIPLSNTNQLWGLAWGALVFGELAALSTEARMLVVGGSLVMIAGAVAIGLAEAPASEQASWRLAMERECRRYGLDPVEVAAAVGGEEATETASGRRPWWEFLIVAGALAIFVWLGLNASSPAIAMDYHWMAVLSAFSLVFLAVGGMVLWRRTRFS